jgi:lysophospholipase L1-like esterase
MVRTAQAAGLEVFVLSVLPISWNNRAGQPCDPLIPPFNQALQAAITAQGAYWVDDYSLFVGHPDLQIDGVHPNEAGYQVMEQAYAAAVAAAEGQ